MSRINLLLLAVLLAGCRAPRVLPACSPRAPRVLPACSPRAPRVLDADEQAIVDGSRDLEAAAYMLNILTAGRAVGYGQPTTAE